MRSLEFSTSCYTPSSPKKIDEYAARRSLGMSFDGDMSFGFYPSAPLIDFQIAFLYRFLFLQEMNDKEKKTFNDMTEMDRIRYEREMKEYVSRGGKAAKRTKKKKDPNAPKRPQ